MTLGVREALLGPSYFYHRRLIDRSKSWSRDDVCEYQEKRFRLLTRMYGDKVTEKEDYRQSPGEYTRWGLPLITRDVRTGGTSGQPLRFKADTFARRQKERAYIFDIWSQVGYRPFDLRVGYRDRADTRRKLVTFDRLQNQLRISMNLTGARHARRLRNWLRTLPPFFLHVYPSSLFTFIDLVGEDLFRSLPIRGVMAGSEAFPSAQRTRFEEEFGIRVAHWYGHSEYAALAYYCRECCGFHFYPTYGHVELLPSETEGCQRVIASSFNRIGTQFVRYDTGDLAIGSGHSCPANSFTRVDAIVGRSQETFVDSSGRTRALFGYVFGDEKSLLWDQIRDLQVVQDRPGALRIRLVTNPGADKGQIQQYFEQRLSMAWLEFEHVPLIERTPSGKRRYFVNAL